jgi:hypothetical protein
MSKRMFARAGALLGAVVVSAGVLVGVAAPAYAASLGEVTLSSTSGTVSATPMFASATSAACPTGYGENAALRVGRPGGPYSNLGPAVGGGGFDTAPVTIAANRSFTTALGGVAPGDGEWWVIIECYSLTLGRHVDEFRTSIRVTGANWSIPVATPTSTTLAVSPASPVTAGTEVTLTATVAPTAAAGTVEFRRGSTPIGSSPVAGGAATLATTALPVGTHALTAVFTPTDSTSYTGSTSAAVSYTVNAPTGAITAQEEIIADIAPGAFTLVVAGNTVRLTGGTVGGTATGNLQTATVTDLRGSNAGWNLTGQLEDFSSPASATIPNANLTWNPTAAKTSGSGSVTPGAATNLGDTRTLCSAPVSGSAGVFTCGAGLSLAIPDNVPPGEYAATLTLTLA